MRASRIGCVTLLLTWIGGLPVVGESPPSPPASTLVATTPSFEFHSDPWHNLHDFLYWRAQQEEPRDAGASCLAELPEAERSGWIEADRHYRETMGERHHRRDSLMRATRYRLSGTADLDDPALPRLFELLEGARAAYEACFWSKHDAANRRRIANLVPLVITLGPALKTRLVTHYQEPWPDAVHVDVVQYASWAGANTASGRDVPPHMQISSVDESTEGLSGLELLLHESTHEMFGARHGTIGETIGSVVETAGADPPRDLWHAISFYTSGCVMEEVVAESTDDEYEAYWRRTGLMQRAWPEYLPPLEAHWKPYLEGRGTLLDALTEVIDDLLPADSE